MHHLSRIEAGKFEAQELCPSSNNEKTWCPHTGLWPLFPEPVSRRPSRGHCASPAETVPDQAGLVPCLGGAETEPLSGRKEPLGVSCAILTVFTQTWIFVLWCKFWEIGANLLWTKEFRSEQTKFEISLVCLDVFLGICLPHPLPTPPSLDPSQR